MPMLQNGHLMIKDCTIVWDAITRPEINDGGNTRWSLKVVINPNNPDVALLNQLANDALLSSEFKGVLPNGGIMPVGTATSAEFSGLFPGFAVVNASTFRVPKVHAEGGALMQPMEYGNLLYSGQNVDIIVSCQAYNNKSKGIAARMDGFMINTSKQAPQIALGGGGFDTASAFGGHPQQAPQQQFAPQQAPQQQFAPQQAPQGQAPAQQFAPQQAPQGQAPAQQFAPQQAPQQPQQGGQPQQSTNFLPQQ